MIKIRWHPNVRAHEIKITYPDSDEKILEFSKNLKIPVINGLSPSSHPTQVLSDVFTVEEIKKNI